ncbi:caveolin-3-like [Centruroides vittatus]|uniref:caveolin-3-like n=1 Tax=Centruroides vittatus TaxID=120091 RepID=UPI00350FEBD6
MKNKAENSVIQDTGRLSEYLQQLRDDLQLDTIPLKKEAEKWEATYLQVEFEDIIAEPEGTHSPECVWKNAQKVYSGTKNSCYSCLSVCCALPISFFVAISFACVTFQHVWCLGPAVKHFRIACHVVRQYVVACLEACIAPCCGVMGLLFSRIAIFQATKSSTRQLV